MKRIIAMLLAVLLVAGLLTACSGSGNDNRQDGGQSSPTEDSKEQTAPTTQTTPSLEDWGMLDAKAVQGENGLKRIVFRWPAIVGRDAHTAKVENQNDGTIVMVDNYVPGHSPEIDSIDKVFPAYFEQTAKSFSSFYKGKYSDGSFTIENTETVTVKGYEFYKYSGKHTYMYDGNERCKQYVIYLTTMKLNGAYLYFLASDVTADQSAAAKMEENAYNMVLSFREED